jgi:hypothetical protein
LRNVQVDGHPEKIVNGERPGTSSRLSGSSRSRTRSAAGAEGGDLAGKCGSRDALRSGDSIAIAITIDGMPKTDYSPITPGEKSIRQITGTIVERLYLSRGL